MNCQKKVVNLTPDSLYASSLYRRNQVLEGVPQMETLENLTSVSICLMNCMRRKPECKSLNWGNGECVLMTDSVCANETLVLIPKDGYSYYDLMEHPDYEIKHLEEGWCTREGRCSGSCYPRTPYFFDTPMTKKEAVAACAQLGRTLPQPITFEDVKFFANFTRYLIRENPDIRNNKDMKFWFGISDKEMEGVWMYDNGKPLSLTFPGWAPGQPDTGGPYTIVDEDCSGIGENLDMKLGDFSCRLKLKFYCA